MAIPRFPFRVAPWQHQRRALSRSWELEYFGLFMEQGTGKTKVIIDTAAALFLAGRIDAMLVIAPEGVQTGWVDEELGKHMTKAVPYVAGVYRNSLGIAARREFDALMRIEASVLRVLAVNYDTLATKGGKIAAANFLRTYRTLLVADESHKIKSGAAARTKVALNLSSLAPYRRILTGTPAAQSPLDLFTQCRFLDPEVLGISSFVAFKAHYCVLEGSESHLYHHIRKRLEIKYGKERAAAMRPQLVKRDDDGLPMYRNLDELYDKVARHSFRVLKSECLDLPPKVYERRVVQLGGEQRRLYDELVTELMVEYEGGLLTAPLAITRYQRLQQITGGFFKRSKEAQSIPIRGGNPKITALIDLLESIEGKALIWARYSDECQAIAFAVREAFGHETVAEYWGGINRSARLDGRLRFVNDPECRFFVGNQAAGGTGIDGLQVASTVVYFSNDFSLTTRLQSEDRAHRGGSERHARVTIVDLVADKTLDDRVLTALRNKKEIANLIVGDDPKDWV